MKRFLKFLNGKKTLIGFALVTASDKIPDPTIQSIVWVIGTVIGSIGAAHKFKKGELKTK